MKNFVYNNPCNIIFGDNAESKIGKSCLNLNAKKVLLHYGGGSIKQNGLYDKVIKSLKECDIEYIELSGVKPNPRLSLVREGIEICKKENIDLILAVGGGSVIDSAKTIAIGATSSEDVWNYFLDTSKVVDKALPVGVVLTIPAAGSETSNSTVITDEETLLKRSYGTDHIIPKFAIMNPKNTFSMPVHQIAYGVSDMLAHIMERYFTRTEHVDLGDRLLEANFKNILRYGYLAIKKREDYNVRAEIMWAGTLAHNGILGKGRDEDWASHLIEHEISGEYDIAHGAGLSIIFPAWMKHVYKVDKRRFVQFANRIFGIDYNSVDDDNTIFESIRHLEMFYKSIGLPTRLSDINIDSSKFDTMTERLFYARKSPVGQFKELSKEDVLDIFKLAE